MIMFCIKKVLSWEFIPLISLSESAYGINLCLNNACEKPI